MIAHLAYSCKVSGSILICGNVHLWFVFLLSNFFANEKDNLIVSLGVALNLNNSLSQAKVYF